MRSSLICAARFLSAGEILETLAKEASEGKVRESLGYYVNSVATCYSHFPAGDVFILCVNVWRYFHRMGPPSLTLRGHGQSKLLFLLTCHSHVMSQPTKEREGEAGGEEEEEEEKKKKEKREREKKKAAVEDIVVIEENAQKNVEGALPSDRRS